MTQIAICDTKPNTDGKVLFSAIIKGVEAHSGHCAKRVEMRDGIAALEGSAAVVVVCFVDPLKSADRSDPMRQFRFDVRNWCRKNGTPMLVIETGFFNNSRCRDRREISVEETYWAAGWNGIKHDADYCLPDVIDDARWKWRYPPERRETTNETVVVFGQVEGGYAESGPHWLTEYNAVYAEIRESGRRAVMKPHPASNWKSLRRKVGAMYEVTDEEWDVLQGDAACGVTWMSNASVDVLMAGTPLICLSNMNVLRDVGLPLASIGDPEIVPLDQRIAALHRLSYMQWNLGEFRSGEAWEQLKRRLS